MASSNIATTFGAHERAKVFDPDIEGAPQCPNCWELHDRRQTQLDALSGTEQQDCLKCKVCGYDITTPAT